MSESEDLLVEESISLARKWLDRADSDLTTSENNRLKQLMKVINDPNGLSFAMRFIDQVARPQNVKVAGKQLYALGAEDIPNFLSHKDKLLFKVGSKLALRVPNVAVRLAIMRMRQIVGDLVLDAEIKSLDSNLNKANIIEFRKNVNLLGETVFGDYEAKKRFESVKELIKLSSIDYVSIKISSIAPRLNHWDFYNSFDRVVEKLKELFTVSKRSHPVTFLNLDMEEYKDLHLTVSAFKEVLSSPDFFSVDAGIVLQAYIPDSYNVLRELNSWANERKVGGGGTIKIRLVKGANLSMEKVDAEIHGWEQAPYLSKHEVDSNYKRCLDWCLRKDRLVGVRIGIASHNIFDLAWAYLLADKRRVSDRIEFEMLQGMAPAQSRLLHNESFNGVLVYTPVVSGKDFELAISYLFRRLEENSSEGNFLRSLLTITKDKTVFESEAEKFKASVLDRWGVYSEPRRLQSRPEKKAKASGLNYFVNEPDTDPVLENNITWVNTVAEKSKKILNKKIDWIDSVDVVDNEIRRAKAAQIHWRDLPAEQRSRLICVIGDELSKRRGDLIAQMMSEANKTFSQADSEVSEAIDFAYYYGQLLRDLNHLVEMDPNLNFKPLGVVTVTPPWNFPVAIVSGGIFSALATGNSVILKPAPQTPGCAQIVAECCWQAGISFHLLRFLPMKDGEASKSLILKSDGVILTGSSETAEMFQSWKPEINLFAETSGKNSIIVTPTADIDQAVQAIVSSAFEHAGQKCSAASIVISIDGICSTPRFKSQLVDAVNSLVLGDARDLSTDVAELVLDPDDRLSKALNNLDPGESWLVEPRKVSGNLWSPGVKTGVEPGSWFQQTECFGPVLGIVETNDLVSAVNIQNSTDFGLTSGIFSLNPNDIHYYLNHVQAGNVYVNRTITGAIVQRQPFGGWKKSSIGPGYKAGGPNYLQQLGKWSDQADKRDSIWLSEAIKSDNQIWENNFSRVHDPSNLKAERNIFRYLPLDRVILVYDNTTQIELINRAKHAAEVCGTKLLERLVSSSSELIKELINMQTSGAIIDKVRVLNKLDPALLLWAIKSGVYIDNSEVVANARIEMLKYLKEQSISITNHRFGNYINSIDYFS